MAESRLFAYCERCNRLLTESEAVEHGMGRTCRWNSALEAGKTYKIEAKGNGLFLVTSPIGDHYAVDIHERTCTCPWFMVHGRNCKHIKLILRLSNAAKPPKTDEEIRRDIERDFA